jgi:hypothetical protein
MLVNIIELEPLEIGFIESVYLVVRPPEPYRLIPRHGDE